jgi:hypothetical protein
VRARGWIVGCAILCVSTGCYRTVYRNLEPAGDPALARVAPRRSPGWRSFFLYGWLPRELVVQAAAECGGPANVREIRTRRSFPQGLVAKFASSAGVNVYSPWTGEVVCGEHDPSRAADLGRAVGVTYSDTAPLRPEEKEMQRDEKRKSSR